MRIKKIIVRFIVCIEMCTFGYMYLCGKNGLQLLQKQKKDLSVLEHECTQIQKEIDTLQQDIFVWQTNDFCKEKIAREQLQMARKDDKLFYIGS